MIVCHRHRFIFIRTHKTASTSVELLLRQFCGPDDVITRETRDDERLARRLGLPGHRNHGATPVPPWRIGRRDLWWARRNRRYPHRPGIHPHADASTIRAFVGDDVWNSYTKITTVRDPWEATVSLYHWRRQFGPRRSRVGDGSDAPGRTLDDAVERAGRNWSIYTIDGVPVVDHVIRFERLAEDVAVVCAALGLHGRLELPGAKRGLRSDTGPATGVLSVEQARRVAELARGEIEWLGYEWSGPDLG